METKLKTSIQTTIKVYDKFWLLSGIVAVLLFLVYSLNLISPDSVEEIENKSIFQTDCKISDVNLNLNNEEGKLRTITQISNIDFSTEVFQSQMSKNEIKALDKVNLTNFEELSSCVTEDDEAIVVKVGESVRVYLKNLLIYHQIVNDTLNGQAILVTRCNICNSYNVYLREYKNQELIFKISGYFYKNNDLLYDNQTESLWSQFDGKARVGNYSDAQLVEYPYQVMTVKEIMKEYSNPEFVSYETGYVYNYLENPYKIYEEDNVILFKMQNYDSYLPPKTLIYGIKIQNKQYFFVTSKVGTKFDTTIDGMTLSIDVSGGKQKASLSDNYLQLFPSYYFVWNDFYPFSQEILVNQ